MTRQACSTRASTAFRYSLLLLATITFGCAKKEAAPAPTVNLGKLAEQTQRLWDVHEVANLMGLYVHYNRNGLDADTVGLFAIDDADVAAEFPGEGRYIGKDEVSKRLTWHERMQRARRPEFYGRFMEHTLVSPIIVVADDGLTAKAIWSQVGYEAINVSKDATKPNVIPINLWGKYAVDFKKIGSQWKIWHLHVYPTFAAANGAPWTKAGRFNPPNSATTIAEAAPATQQPNDKEVGLTPPHARQGNGPFWSYSPQQPYPPREQPKAPMPYATWAATFSY
jgi:hypothetical protein